MKRNRNRKNLYGILIIFFLCLGIGYAALTTNLSINGISHVTNSSWDVHWENVQVTSGSVEAEEPTFNASQTGVSFSVTLTQPGDFYEFTVDAVNAGTIDAMIEEIVSTINGNPISQLPVYLAYSLTYSDGLEIESNHLLSAGDTETYKVKLLYRQDINPGDLPGTNQSFTVEVSTNYIQRNSNAVAVFHPVDAGTLLVTNPDGTTPKEKSPYVLYEYGNNQSILCRVLYDANSSYGIQIISNTSTEDVTLGTTDDTLGIEKYNNAIFELNQIAGAYLTGNQVADHARCVGSTPNSIETSEGANNMLVVSGYNRGNGIYKDEDNDYEEDFNQLVSLEIELGSQYWMASRAKTLIGSYRLEMRYASYSPSGAGIYTIYNPVMSDHELVRLYSTNYTEDEYHHYEATEGFRPIFKLKSNVKVVGGSGTESDPYLLGF